MVDNTDFMPIAVEHTEYCFVGTADGRIFIATGNRKNDEGNVSFLGSAGKFRTLDDEVIWSDKLTIEDIPKRDPDGFIDDGTENKVWVIPYRDWLGLAKKHMKR